MPTNPPLDRQLRTGLVEPFVPGPDEPGYPVPFADTWVGEGWLAFGKRKYAQAAGPGCAATRVIRFEACTQFRGGGRL
jgi:hypothetical protein